MKTILSSSRCRKSFWQNWTPIYDFKKILQKIHIEGTHLKIIKAIYKKPTTNIILNVENGKHFLYDQEQDKGAHYYLT